MWPFVCHFIWLLSAHHHHHCKEAGPSSWTSIDRHRTLISASYSLFSRVNKTTSVCTAASRLKGECVYPSRKLWIHNSWELPWTSREEEQIGVRKCAEVRFQQNRISQSSFVREQVITKRVQEGVSKDVHSSVQQGGIRTLCEHPRAGGAALRWRCPCMNCEILWALHNYKTAGTFSLLSGASGTVFAPVFTNPTSVPRAETPQ